MTDTGSNRVPVDYLARTAKRLASIYSLGYAFISVNPYDGGEVHLTYPALCAAFGEDGFRLEEHGSGAYRMYTMYRGVKFFALVDRDEGNGGRDDR